MKTYPAPILRSTSCKFQLHILSTRLGDIAICDAKQYYSRNVTNRISVFYIAPRFLRARSPVKRKERRERERERESGEGGATDEPFRDTSFNNPKYRVLLLNRGLCPLKGMNPITMASAGQNFRANGFWHEIPARLYQRRLQVQRERIHCRLSFRELLLRRTIFSGHVTVRFRAAPFESILSCTGVVDRRARTY